MGGKRKKTRAKKQKANLFVRIFRVRAWKIILILIPLAFTAATFLRIDHIEMMQLKHNVLESDRNANEDTLAIDLQALREFVAKHVILNVVDDNGTQYIEFGTGPFYLKESYHRKAEEAIRIAREEAANQDATTNPYGNVFLKVSAVCDEKGRRYGWRYPDRPYIDCWMSELDSYPGADKIEVTGSAKLPNPDLYRLEYSSPIWYPCASGITVLICAILIIMLIIRFFVWAISGIASRLIDSFDN